MDWQPIETAPKMQGRSILLALFSSQEDSTELLCECRMVGLWDGDQFTAQMGVTTGDGWGVLATALIPWTHWFDFGNGATMPPPPND